MDIDLMVTTVAETKLVSVASKRLFERQAMAYQDYENIRQSCVSRGRLFKVKHLIYSSLATN